MIVQRMTVRVKKGHMQDALNLLKEYRKQEGYEYRLYESDLGTFDQISLEFEFDNFAARENFWAEWRNAPTTPAFFEKWLEFIKTGGTNEIWTLL